VTKTIRWELVIMFAVVWVASALVAFLAVGVLQRECSYPPAFVRPPLASTLVALVVGEWLIVGLDRRWAARAAFATLALPPIFAIFLSKMCLLAWL
jgi:hypothetical protein